MQHIESAMRKKTKNISSQSSLSSNESHLIRTNGNRISLLTERPTCDFKCNLMNDFINDYSHVCSGNVQSLMN